MSRMFHKSIATAEPTVRKVNRPTILQPRVSASETPVKACQNHHDRVKGLCVCQLCDNVCTTLLRTFDDTLRI